MAMEWDGDASYSRGKSIDIEVSNPVKWNKAFRFRTFRTDINKTVWFSTVYEKRIPSINEERVFETIGEDAYLVRKLAGTVDDDYVRTESTWSYTGHGSFIVGP